MSLDAFGNQSLNIELGLNILEAMDMSDEELGESRDSTQVNWKAGIVDMKEHLLLLHCVVCANYVHCVIPANYFAWCCVRVFCTVLFADVFVASHW